MQILNPNPDAMTKMITENASEEFLHSLSNYCALQVNAILSFYYVTSILLAMFLFARIIFCMDHRIVGVEEAFIL
jgi:hypothetical protein